MPFRQLKSFLKILIGVQYQFVKAPVEKLPSGRPETFGVPGICLRGVDVLYGSSDFSLGKL